MASTQGNGEVLGFRVQGFMPRLTDPCSPSCPLSGSPASDHPGGPENRFRDGRVGRVRRGGPVISRPSAPREGEVGRGRRRGREGEGEGEGDVCGLLPYKGLCSPTPETQKAQGKLVRSLGPKP